MSPVFNDPSVLLCLTADQWLWRLIVTRHGRSDMCWPQRWSGQCSVQWWHCTQAAR